MADSWLFIKRPYMSIEEGPYHCRRGPLIGSVVKPGTFGQKLRPLKDYTMLAHLSYQICIQNLAYENKLIDCYNYRNYFYLRIIIQENLCYNINLITLTKG